MTLENLSQLVVCFAAFWVSLSFYKHLRRQESENPWQRLEQEYVQLDRKAKLLFDKVGLLELHGEKYFHSLHEAGLGELITTRNALTKVIDDLRQLMKENNSEGVNELMKFLRNPFAKPFPKLAAYTSADLRFLEDWEKKTDDLIISCVVKLGVMQSKNGAVGNNSVRRPTIHTLDELRRTLAENRPV